MFEPSSGLMVEAAQIIEKGAATIEEVGWCQDKLYDKQTGAVCLFGGLQLAMGLGTSEGAHTGWTGDRGTPLRKAIVQAMLDEVYPGSLNQDFDVERSGMAEHLSSYWNDKSTTTMEMVTTAMRAAAQRLYKRAGVA